MNATHSSPPALTLKTSLTLTHVLAELLERLEHSKVPVDPGQYRLVADHLVAELGQVQPGVELSAILETHPAAAELYENLNYQHAGLCRSPLDASLAAEQQAIKAIHGARHRQSPQLEEGSPDEQS